MAADALPGGVDWANFHPISAPSSPSGASASPSGVDWSQFQPINPHGVPQAHAVQKMLSAPVQPNQVGQGVNIPQSAQPAPEGFVTEAEHAFSAVGHGIAGAAQQGYELGKELIESNLGNDAAGHELRQSALHGAREIGGHLAEGTGSVLHGLSELARSNTPTFTMGADHILHEGAPTQSPVSKALDTAGTFSSAMGKQDIGNLKPGPLGVAVSDVAEQIPFALSLLTGAGEMDGALALGRGAAGVANAIRLGAVSAGITGHDVRKTLETNPQIVQSTPEYKAALKSGMSGAEAQKFVTGRMVDNAMAATGVVTAMAAGLTPGINRLVDPMLQVGGMGAAARMGANIGTGQPVTHHVGRALLGGAGAGALWGLADIGSGAVGGAPHGEAPTESGGAPKSEPPKALEAKTPASTAESPAQETAAAMREVDPGLTGAQNVQAFADRLRKGGVPESEISKALSASPHASALDTMKALRKAANRYFSLTPEERAHVHAHQGRQGTAAESQAPGVGAVEGKQTGAGQETKHGNAAPDQQGVGQTEVTDRAAPVVDALRTAGVAAPVKPDGRVVVTPDNPDAGKAVEIAAHDAAESPQNERKLPTEGQMREGNYPKGKLLFKGATPADDVPVNIENPMGSIRRAVAPATWTSRPVTGGHYGYIPGTRSADGEPLDVFVGRNAADPSLPVHVIQQTDAKGAFDEHKVMFGYKSAKQALNAYRSNYPQHLHDTLTQMKPRVVTMTRAQFGQWLHAGEHDVPINPMSRAPMSALRQHGPLEASFAPNAEAAAIHDATTRLNEKHGLTLKAETSGIGSRVTGDVPRALAPAVHRELSKVEGHVQTTHTHSGSRTVLRAGSGRDGEGTGAGREALSDAKSAEQPRSTGVPPGAPEAPKWITAVASEAPEHADGHGAHPVSVVGVHYAAQPGLTELPAEQSGHALANHRTYLVREGAKVPTAPSERGHPYEVRLTNLYDMRSDPEGIVAYAKAKGIDKTETVMRAIRAAGYDGAVMPSEHGPVALSFSKKPIPVTAAKAASAPTALSEPEIGELAKLRAEREIQRPHDVRLPPHLAKAQPRYAYGPKKFALKFDNDLDRSAYIIAGSQPSEQDDAYLAFVMQALGADEGEARAAGARVRATIKGLAKNAQGGTAKAPKTLAVPRVLSMPAETQALGSHAQKRLLDLQDKERHTATIGNSGELLPDVLNRAAFNTMDQRGLRGAHVAYLDADQFKQVNDLLGHEAGDDLLRSIASRLKEQFGAGAVHKLGGDEFVVHHDDPAELERGIDAVNQKLKAEVAAQEGHPVKGIGLSRGIGTTLEEAESRLQANKRERRVARGSATDRAQPAGPERAEDHAQHETDHPIVQVPLNELTLSQDVPQFKSGADARGIVEPLGGTFDERGTGPIQVWVRNDGSKEVISGRHRFAKALDTKGKTHIAAQLHYESKGFTREMAASLDAELNIRDGNGKVKDYVQYFGNPAFDGEAGRQEAESRGLLARATGQRAYTIARQGSPTLIAAHQADQIGDEAAYQIARAAPNNERVQALGMKMVQEGKSVGLAQNTMRAIQTLAPSQDNGDLFGFNDSAIKDAKRMGELALAKQREINEDLAAVSGAVKRPERARKRGVDVHDPESIARDNEKLKAERAAWDNWATDPGRVAILRKELGIESPEAPEDAPVPAQEAAQAHGDMFGAPTTADHLDALERAKDAHRNGLDTPGRKDMLSGGGDLFAGPRPEQGQIGEDLASYQGEHKPPGPDSGAPLSDLTHHEVFPEDVYSAQGVRYYGTGDAALDRQAYAIVQRMRGKPDGWVTVYRAVPDGTNGSIQSGDWVTTVRQYAAQHGEGRLNGAARILSKQVRARDLFTNPDAGVGLEWGYHPQPPTVGHPPAVSEGGIADGSVDPYAGKELRSDAPDIIEKGRAAFHRFAARYGGTVLGDAIGREIVQSGRSQLVGKHVESTDDLAAISAVARNPTFETLHYLLADDAGTVVDDVAFTSRLPGIALAWNDAAKTLPSIASELQARASEIGATKLWMLHNHPSGNPTPSAADINLTKGIEDGLGTGDKGLRLGGHVVIDHTTYAIITPLGVTDVRSLPQPLGDFRARPSKPHALLGQTIGSPAELGAIARDAARDLGQQVGIVTTTSKNAVGSLFSLPTELMKSPRVRMLLRRLGQRSGAARMFAVTPDAMDAGSQAALRDMMTKGLLTDVVDQHGRRTFPELMPTGEPDGSVLGRAVKSHQVREDLDPYDLHKADDDDRKAPPFDLKPDHPPIVKPFDRERAKELDYSKRSPIVQTKVAHRLFRQALAWTDRLDSTSVRAFASAQAMFDKRDPQQNIQDMVRVQKGLPINDPATEAFFKAFADMADRRVEMIRAFGEGDLENVRAHYFPQYWKDPAKAEQALAMFQKGTLEGGKGFLQQRMFPTIQDGIDAGLEPWSTNPADLAMRHLHEMDRFIALHQFRMDLYHRGLTHLVEPGERMPPGFARVDDYAFQIARGLGGEVAVPKPIAQFINNYLNPGFNTDDNMGAVFRGLRSVEAMQLALKLGFSLFHAGFTSFDHLATNLDVARGHILHGRMRAAAGALKSAVLTPMTAAQGLAARGPGAKLVRQYLGQEPMDANTEAVLGALMQGGARAYMHPSNELNALHTAVRALRQRKYLKAGAKFIPATLEAMMLPIAHNLVPAQKMFARVAMMKNLLDNYAKEVGQNPGNYQAILEGMHPDFLRQMAAKVVDQVDDRLGQMNKDNLAMNKYLQQVLDLVTMAPTFQIGTARVIGGPVVDLLRALPKSGKKFGVEYGPEEAVAPVNKGESAAGKQGNLPFWTSRMTYLLTMVGAFSAANMLATYLMTGKGPKSVEDLFTMTMPDGTRISLPTYMRAAYEFGTDPIQTIENKANPTMVMLGELMRNRTYNNTLIFRDDHSNGALGDVLQHLREAARFFGSQVEPIAVENEQEARHTSTSTAMKVLPFFGVTRAPEYMQRSDYQNYVASRYRQDFEGGARTEAQVQRSRAIERAVAALHAGQKPDLSAIAPVDRHLVYQYAHSDPYASMMKRLPIEQRIRAYELATPKERTQFHLGAMLYAPSNYKQIERLPPDERDWVRSQLKAIQESRQ